MPVIAIVGGTGPEGSGLAQRWARAGQHIIIGSRDAARASDTAQKISAATGNSQIAGKENKDAVAAADVIVLTVPFEGHVAMLKHVKSAFKPGAILVDATVALAASVGGRATRTLSLWQGSVAQQAAELVPQGVSVVAAFQNVSHTLLEGDSAVDCDVLLCTDDEPARQIVAELVEKIAGVRAVNAGALENARTVEQITALLIAINIKHKIHSAGIRITGLPSKGQPASH